MTNDFKMYRNRNEIQKKNKTPKNLVFLPFFLFRSLKRSLKQEKRKIQITFIKNRYSCMMYVCECECMRRVVSVFG